MHMMCPGLAGKRHSHKRATATQKEGEAEGCSGQAQAEPVGQSGLGAGHGHWHALPGGRPLLVRMALRALPRRTSTAHQHGELNPSMLLSFLTKLTSGLAPIRLLTTVQPVTWMVML